MAKKIIILGGGVAGMSAAHELAERGFEVEVYDKHRLYAGGKARSVPVPGSNKLDHDKYLPGEHGFRFFPGFYKHVIDTIKRIPYQNHTVYDNLVAVNRMALTRAGKKSIETIVNFPRSIADIRSIFTTLHADIGLTTEEKEFFAKKIWQLMTSCMERRIDEYEKQSWWDYLEADRFSDNYRTLFVQGITRTLVAANARTASTKTDGDIFLQLLFNMTNPGVHTDRVLCGPTNDVWIEPWLQHLRSNGVNYHFNQSVREIQMKDRQVEGVWIEEYYKGVPKRTLVSGDYYILAVPIEVAATLVNEEMLATDPALDGIKQLAPSVAWMNGIQFYLSGVPDLVHGHCLYVDSPWALTSISQLPFWKDYDMSQRYNGKIETILSVDISNWDEPGLINNKPARQCTYAEIKKEVWAQLKASLNVDGKTVLHDEDLQHWYIDHDITVAHHQDDKNKEPLLVNTVDSWKWRPESITAINNLFLASDYVRTFTDLATMEGANEAARKAVNGILEASQSSASRCEIWNLHEPDILEPLRRRDQKRYEQNLPYQFHLPFLLKVVGWIARLLAKIFPKTQRLPS